MKLTVAQSQALKAEFAVKLEKLLTAIAEKAQRQFDYSLLTNVPKGVLKSDEIVDNAIDSGLVGGASHISEWGVEKTISLALDILEDSNCHTEARALSEAAAKNGVTLNS